jgi:hypothetical protein
VPVAEVLSGGDDELGDRVVALAARRRVHSLSAMHAFTTARSGTGTAYVLSRPSSFEPDSEGTCLPAYGL